MFSAASYGVWHLMCSRRCLLFSGGVRRRSIDLMIACGYPRNTSFIVILPVYCVPYLMYLSALLIGRGRRMLVFELVFILNFVHPGEPVLDI